MKQQKNYFLGLDVGTESIGYAVTNKQYDLLKYCGEPMWGVHLFDEAMLNDDRRLHRSARRRLDRRQQRVKLLQEIFAGEISCVDENFYRRIKESALWREDAQDAYCLFADEQYTDADYHKQYPTIHHLIMDLIDDPKPHDVRLVYLACAWLLAHRGHFFNDVAKENIGDVLDIHKCYRDLMGMFPYAKPWTCEPQVFGDVLKKKLGVNAKYKKLCQTLYNAPKAPKTERVDEEEFYDVNSMLKLLCGGTVSAKDLFDKDEYADIAKLSLNKDDDELAQILVELGDDAELIWRLKAVFDWAVLADILDGATFISKKKVEIYEQHRDDLKLLKRMIRNYAPNLYRDVFRNDKKPGYASYSKSGKADDFNKYIVGIFKNVTPSQEDATLFADMMAKLDAGSFCPKQVNSDNRVIPYQVYWIELKQILDNASAYLPFLNQADEDGYIAKDKILSIMEFRVPYFVGPLNSASKNAWIRRKSEGKILPWNFETMVDLDGSEQAFIDKMTNSCTYLPYADVMPKCALLHEKFQVLNELNSIQVLGQRLSVELKQKIFLDLFCEKKKVTVKAIKTYIIAHGYYTESDLDTLGGIDETIKSSLPSYHFFKRLLRTKQLSEADAEAIILHATYTEDRVRLTDWVNRTYPFLSEDDRKHLSGIKCKDFARLSRKLLCELYGTETDSETGEAVSIIDRMWNENLNLMEILSDRYTYRAQIQDANENYYREHPKSLDERLKDMYISNTVKRAIIRTMDVVSDVVKANGCVPAKIFIEMARGGKADDKGKRTRSRYQQLKELYAKCDLEYAREMEEQLESLGEDRDNRLQGEKLFLYFLQLGRSMYSGTVIDLHRLSDKSYDIDHIYPQSKVKDDSILNNKVLVLSEENGNKGDRYPISKEIRRDMRNWWKMLFDNGFITAEKYQRLTRHTPFDENEEWGFINRQLVETRQSTKALATLLREKYPTSEIVYVKAGMVSEFRQEFDMLKSRAVNDLHHAKDAYLNVVVGNVYNERFTHRWFLSHRDSYNLKVSTLFTHPVVVDDRTVWDGTAALGKVKHIVHNKNAVHLTRFAFCRKGGLFDQQPKAFPEGAIPRKEGMSVEKYGGYCKASASFFVLAKYSVGKKTDIMLVPIELLASKRFDSEVGFAEYYVQDMISSIIGKTAMNVEFPVGLRKIKINTMFDFDGMRMCIAGKSSGGKAVIPSLSMSLIVSYDWEKYIKNVERFYEKKKENPNMIYRAEYDKITTVQNIVLYDLLIEKLESKAFVKRPNNPVSTLKKGKGMFVQASIYEQVKCLMQILSLFGRVSGGCDLQTVGGAGRAAAMVGFSSSLGNWKKNYSNVCIIDQSASGLFEKHSVNLLDLL